MRSFLTSLSFFSKLVLTLYLFCNFLFYLFYECQFVTNNNNDDDDDFKSLVESYIQFNRDKESLTLFLTFIHVEAIWYL